MIVFQDTDQNLSHTLQFGFGLHHAGLNNKDRSFVEEIFANNKIQVGLLLLFEKYRQYPWLTCAVNKLYERE